MYITGGGNGGDLCKLTDQDCAVGGAMALASGSITGVLFQVADRPIAPFSDTMFRFRVLVLLQDPPPPRARARTPLCCVLYSLYLFVSTWL